LEDPERANPSFKAGKAVWFVANFGSSVNCAEVIKLSTAAQYRIAWNCFNWDN